jgi:hypothetical protein
MEVVRSGVFCSLSQILEKRVLPSLLPLFDNPKLDRELRSMIKETFAEFCDAPIEGIFLTKTFFLSRDGETPYVRSAFLIYFP